MLLEFTDVLSLHAQQEAGDFIGRPMTCPTQRQIVLATQAAQGSAISEHRTVRGESEFSAAGPGKTDPDFYQLLGRVVQGAVVQAHQV